jgi:protein-L-isoaspartate O-methyltransferase
MPFDDTDRVAIVCGFGVDGVDYRLVCLVRYILADCHVVFGGVFRGWQEMKRINGAPFFVHNSIDFLEERLQPTWLCFEWGSGWSTVWLSELTAHVVSMEHDESWVVQTAKFLQTYNYTNVDLIYKPLDAGYADHILTFPDSTFDLIEVDGRRRADCIRNAIAKLKPGGILVIDDSQREGYQKSINETGIRRWEHVDFYGGNSEGISTSVYFKGKGK